MDWITVIKVMDWITVIHSMWGNVAKLLEVDIDERGKFLLILQATDKTIFPFPFTLNGIWSWWQIFFRFWTKWNSIWFKIERKTVFTIISHSMWKEMEVEFSQSTCGTFLQCSHERVLILYTTLRKITQDDYLIVNKH